MGIRGQRGSLTVEAALTMPVILICTFAILVFGAICFERTSRVLTAYEASERAAYVWTDSHKDALTGAFSYGEMDNPYGGILRQGLSLLTSLWKGFPRASAPWPNGIVEGDAISQRKLTRSVHAVQEEADSGRLAYTDRFFEQTIRAEIGRSYMRTISFPGIGSKRFGDVDADAVISDPVGLLRTVDLIRMYGSRLHDYIAASSNEDPASEDNAAVEEEQGNRESITSEKEAKAYLLQLIGGRSAEVQTSLGLRHLDVLDGDGIVHEAKYTVNKADAKEQLKKDAELIRTGKVRGVIWHFFPLKKTGKPDITQALIRDMEANGILWVIHT